MRALLVANPKATAATGPARDTLLRRLGGEAEILEAITEHRGHAVHLARDGVERGVDAVIALGGDGTVNEVVNGLLGDGAAPDPPALGVVPCGFANVFARALGLPNHPLRATETLLAALRGGRRRTVSVGRADDRYFTFCAGVGFDAAVIGAVEERRAAGRRSRGSLYVRSALRHYLTTDRRTPSLELQVPGGGPVPPLFMAIVTNTSPWTYLGRLPLTPTPRASFLTGLDAFGMTTFGPLPVARSVARLLARSPRVADPRWSVALHDLGDFSVTAPEALDFQVDGEYLGRRRRVRFRSVPDALRVIV